MKAILLRALRVLRFVAPLAMLFAWGGLKAQQPPPPPPNPPEADRKPGSTPTERELPKEHVALARSLRERAGQLNREGKHAEAEKEWRALTDLMERNLGAENEGVCWGYVILAKCLEVQGKAKEALDSLQRADAGYRKASGANYREAELVQAFRKQFETELLFQDPQKLPPVEAGAGQGPAGSPGQRRLKAEDIMEMRRRSQHARELAGEGKLAGAEKEYRAMLAVFEGTHGAEALSEWLACHALAECLEAQGLMQEALGFAQRAEQGFKAYRGPHIVYAKKAKELRERIEAASKAK